MSLTVALVAIMVIAVAAGLFARNRANGCAAARPLNSLPNYHARFVGLWALLPALLFLAIWTPIQGRLVDGAVLASPAAQSLPDFAMTRDTILAEARDIANGTIEAGFNPESTALAPVFSEAAARYAAIGGGIAILVALLGGYLALRRVKADFRARTGVERVVLAVLLLASLIAVLTTLGIVLSLMFESLRSSGCQPDRISVAPLEPADRLREDHGFVRLLRVRCRCSGPPQFMARLSP